jgi:GntR family transcriptional regulator
MLVVDVDRSDPFPLHDQVAAEIRRAVDDGEAGPGDRLPLAKDLAAVLGVNKNTVLRSLHILRQEGLLEFKRGRGITVAGTPQRGALVEWIRDLLDFARHRGYQPAEVVELIEPMAGAGR